ncbi:MAG: MBL fold metallo-hydrolase [Brevinema sp.]
MILQQLSDRIYYLPHNPDLDRPTLGYIKGDDYSIMIDCGNSKAHLELFMQGLDERALPHPKLAVITHWHWDHTFGMHAFSGKTLANSLTQLRLQQMSTWIWTDEAMRSRLRSGEEIAFCDEFIRLEYKDLSTIKVVPADQVFEQELVLDLGGVHCQIKQVNWPHSYDSNIIYIPEEKVYFVGDADSEDFYHNHGKYQKDSLEEIIHFWESKEFLWHIHGHLSPQNKDQVLSWLNEELILL